MTNIANRPLTLEEWEARLANAERLLADLDTNIAHLIAWADRAGNATGASETTRNSIIHSTCGKLGSLKGHLRLARRRIERGLV